MEQITDFEPEWYLKNGLASLDSFPSAMIFNSRIFEIHRNLNS